MGWNRECYPDNMRRSALVWLCLASSVSAQTAADLLDGSRLQDVRLYVFPDDWRKLRANYLDNTEYPCEFIWRGLVADCEVRSRGRGSRTSVKPSLRIDFNFGDVDGFLGLNSLALKNNSQDASMMRERLTMRLFERMGLPAPRETHARVWVNDEFLGLFLMVEPVDKQFLRLRFEENSGYLYQYVQPADPYQLEYLGTNPASYVPAPFKPETHEKKPEPGALIEMIRRVNQTPDREFLDDVSEYLDLGTAMTHIATEQFLAQYDGFLAMNNFFLYRPAGETRHHLLVWDQDGAFTWKERSLWEGALPNALLRRSLERPVLRRAFLEAAYTATALAGGPRGWLAAEIERIYAQIREAALADPVKQCGAPPRACTNEEFEAAVEALREFARERMTFIDAELDVAGFQPRAGSPRLYDAGGVFFNDSPLKLSGENLAEENAGITVLVNGFQAAIESAAPGEIRIQPPAGVMGRVPVTVLRDGIPGNRIWIDLAAAQ